MKRVLAPLLSILLGAPALASPATQAATALSVSHSPVDCMVAGTNPQIEAGISPNGEVRVGRVYFKSALGLHFYYVEMGFAEGRYFGVLPRPLPGAGPITYYIEGLGRDYAQSQSSENEANVVTSLEECKGKAPAMLGPSGPVRVFSATGLTTLPPGFSGFASVAAGAGAGAGSKTAIILASAVAAGVTLALIKGDDNPPASPSR